MSKMWVTLNVMSICWYMVVCKSYIYGLKHGIVYQKVDPPYWNYNLFYERLLKKSMKLSSLLILISWHTMLVLQELESKDSNSKSLKKFTKSKAQK